MIDDRPCCHKEEMLNKQAEEIDRLRSALEQLASLRFQSDQPNHLSERAIAIVVTALKT